MYIVDITIRSSEARGKINDSQGGYFQRKAVLIYCLFYRQLDSEFISHVGFVETEMGSYYWE